MGNLKPIYCYLIIIAVTFLVFHNTLSNGFVFDDESVIINNVSIQKVGNIPKFFTADEGFHKVIGRYYRPVVSATYTIDYEIWGLNPYGFHLTNVIIHIIACLLLFRILSFLFWRYKFRYLISLFATLIFAVHPIHTEAISWISGRTDSLMTMFFFGSFLSYLEFTKEQDYFREKNSSHSPAKKYLYLVISIILYILGLLTKEMIITMPVIILLYDFVYRKKNAKYLTENLIPYILFIGVTVAYVFLRSALLENIAERETYLYFYKKDFETIFATMLKTIPVYFRLLIAPFELLYHYNGVVTDAASVLDLEVILSFAFVIFLITLAIFLYKKDSIISFCILFFLVTLLPVMNIVQTMNLMAERFLYITSFALVLLICHLTLMASAKRDFSLLIVCILIVIFAFSYLTFARNEIWKDNDTLYSSAESVEGTVLLVNQANILANSKKYDEAAELYKRAYEIRDNNLLAHHNLGLIYLLKGSLDSAEAKFNKGISIDSLAPDGYFQLATVYNMQNKKQDAVNILEKLQQISPDYRGSVAILNQLKFEMSSNNKPGTEIPRNNGIRMRVNNLQQSSYMHYQNKNYEAAIKDLQDLIKLNDEPSTKSGYLNNIAMCYGEMNNLQMEEKYFLEAIKLDENNINAMNGLASFYLKRNEKEKSKEYLNMILRINPSEINARTLLDSLNKN